MEETWQPIFETRVHGNADFCVSVGSDSLRANVRYEAEGRAENGEPERSPQEAGARADREGLARGLSLLRQGLCRRR